MNDPDLVLRALERYRDFRIAELLTIAIALGAEKYPDEIKTALAKVFDLSAVEDMAKRTIAIATSAQETAYEIRHSLQQLRHDAEQLGQQLDGLRVWLDELARRVAKAESIMNGPAKTRHA